ncbi:hypothetical protein L1987_84440 [Smallanthus sonchifolius]|uniref:Uncharacterized protein n=1 Tax=Smallanthus sonchifolius TaxID=185202 RepID=A0ACB8YEP8_9ASTR|nr:hypothetical protein L1987_84440 [Smallanthus sonchifolius]
MIVIGNICSEGGTIQLSWGSLGLKSAISVSVRDLWKLRSPSMIMDVMLSILLRFKQTLIVTLSSLLLILHNSNHGAQVWDCEKFVIIPNHYMLRADNRAYTYVDILRDFSHEQGIKFKVSWNTDETWYDLVAVLESECSDEDFQSVLDDVLSLNDSEVASRPSIEIRSKSYEPSNGTKHVCLDEISSSIDKIAGMDNGCFGPYWPKISHIPDIRIESLRHYEEGYITGNEEEDSTIQSSRHYEERYMTRNEEEDGTIQSLRYYEEDYMTGSEEEDGTIEMADGGTTRLGTP